MPDVRPGQLWRFKAQRSNSDYVVLIVAPGEYPDMWLTDVACDIGGTLEGEEWERYDESLDTHGWELISDVR